MNEQSLFLTVVALGTPEERKAFLDQACGADAALRARIEVLVQRHDEAPSFLEHPAIDGIETSILSGDTQEDSRSPVQPAWLAAPVAAEDSQDRQPKFSAEGAVVELGPYEIRAELGRGGMGIVYSAYDPKLRRPVAIKVLAPELAANKTARRRFLREARTAAAVTHPHVVTIHSVGETPVPYLEMELVVGKTLRDKIEQTGILALADVLRIGAEIAEGLAAAHKKGLVHRDVKPANILLENGEERVRITDFGLARALDDVGVTRQGELAGTPQYMSPEQARGNSIDTRSDLFSLGVVLYVMCTGTAPFQGEHPLAVIRAVVDSTPRPITELNAALPDWLAETIEKLLAKQPDERIQTAAEVAKLFRRKALELEFFFPAKPAQKRPATETAPPQPQAAGGGRRRLVGGALGAALVALLCGLWFTLQTPHGQVFVELGDGVRPEEVQIELKGNGELALVDRKKQWTIALREGKYAVAVAGRGDRFQLDASSITVERNQRIHLKVMLKPTTVGVESQPTSPLEESNVPASLNVSDFEIQGEYAGAAKSPTGEEKYGIQIVAGGDDRFLVVGYSGGLPGDGWTQDKSKLQAKAEIQTNALKFKLGKFDGTLMAGKISLLKEGAPYATLAKVERVSPTLGAQPPAGATVLFDGTNADQFQRGRMTADMLLMEGCVSKQQFQDFHMHLEFRTPYLPTASGQARGNSGIFVQGRYEVQILDSFGLEGERNECGAIFSIRRPNVNMCFPPLTWQTYDVDFTAAKYDANGNKIANARISVQHNGVVIQEDVEIPTATHPGNDPLIPELHKLGPGPGPIVLQNYNGNPVRYRNIWVIEKPALAKTAAAAVPAPSPLLTALRREQISPAALAAAGNGDPQQAPASLVAVLGEPIDVLTRSVEAVSFSPDGQWIAVAGGNKILVYDARSYELRRTLTNPVERIRFLRFLPDSKSLVTRDVSGALKLWPVEKEGPPTVVPVELPRQIEMEMSPDGQWLAACGQGPVKLWKWGNWNAPRDLPRPQSTARVINMAFSADSKQLACSWPGDPAVEPVGVYNVAAGTLEQTIPRPSKSRMHLLRFTPDGTGLILGEDAGAIVWDLAARKDVGPRMGSPVLAMAVSPDGKHLVTSRWTEAELWDLATGERLGILDGHWAIGHAWYAEFSPDGKTIAVGDNEGLCYLDVAPFQVRRSWLARGNQSGLRSISLAPDSQSLLTAGVDKAHRLWRLETPTRSELLPNSTWRIGQLHFTETADQYLAALMKGKWEIWDRHHQQPQFTSEAPKRCATISPAGNLIAAQTMDDGVIHVWSVDLKRELYKFGPFKNGVLALAISSDQQLFAAAYEHGHIVIWSLQTGLEIARWQGETPRVMAFLSDHKTLITGDEQGHLCFWDIATHQKQRSYLAHSSAISSMQLVRGDTILISGSTDGTIQLRSPTSASPETVIRMAGPSTIPTIFVTDRSEQYLFATGPTSVIFVHRLPPLNPDSQAASP